MVIGRGDFGEQAWLITPMFITAFLAGALGAAPWIRSIERRLEDGLAGKAIITASYAGAVVLLALCMLSLSAATHNPFIYFRF